MNPIRALAAAVVLATAGLASTGQADVCTCLDRDGSGAADDHACCPAVGSNYLIGVPGYEVTACGSAELSGSTFIAGCIGETTPASYVSATGFAAHGCISVAGQESAPTCVEDSVVGCIFCGCDRTEYDAESCGGDGDCSDPASAHDRDGNPCSAEPSCDQTDSCPTPPEEWCHEKPKAEAQASCIRTCVDGGGDPQGCAAACPLEHETSCTPVCQHPYPCGDEWPAGLEGPFELKEVLHDLIVSHDGVELEVWVGLPDLPEGVKAPVVANISRYYNWCPPIGLGCTSDPIDDPRWWQDEHLSSGQQASSNAWVHSGGVPPIRHVRRGYAMAYVAVRGTSSSGGCFSAGGRDEQLDTTVAIEWLASQPWSNGRVGLTGLSYPARVAQYAHAEAPPSLKSLLIAGIVTHGWELIASPQGAVRTVGPAYYAAAFGLGPVTPPLLPPNAEKNLAWLTGPGPEHVCKDAADAGFTERFLAQFGQERNEAYWTERRSLDRLHNATAAMLNLHGNQDTVNGHAWQTDLLWPVLADTPQRWLAGAWGHEWPNGDIIPGGRVVGGPPDWEYPDLESILFSWHDFWLKGIGPVPEHLSHVDYQDPATGAWKQTSAWPPTEARTEVLYLTDESLSPSPASGSRSFLAVDPVSNHTLVGDGAEFLVGTGVDGWWSALCPDLLKPGDTFGLAYTSAPAEGSVLLAGNPLLDLRITSSLPGGEVSFFLFDLHPDFSCGADQRPTGYDQITAGAIDLRFHEGNWTGRDFPVGEATRVRIDLHHTIRTIQAGHRLALVLVTGSGWTPGQPFFPRIEVIAEPTIESSHVVLPVVEGTFGGSDPALTYPPRPFAPVE